MVPPAAEAPPPQPAPEPRPPPEPPQPRRPGIPLRVLQQIYARQALRQEREARGAFDSRRWEESQAQTSAELAGFFAAGRFITLRGGMVPQKSSLSLRPLGQDP